MSEIFDSSVTFADLDLRDSVLKGLDEAGFQHPTHIQAQLIKPALAGRDLLGQAKTGTGKTAAFGLPILHKAEESTAAQALILAPTRELAVQIVRELGRLGRHTPIRSASVVGGESFKKQIDEIRGGAQIIVGTPGRVMDLMGRRQLPLNNLCWVVLDEVDRMLDIGFREDIRKILSKIKHDHQTIFVSATISEEIEKLARRFMRDDVEKVFTGAKSLTVSLVDQKYVPVQPWDKRRMLTHLLTHEDPALTLVFCRTKRSVDRVARHLNKHEIDAFAIHGDLPQGKRTQIMDRLRKGKLEVLVASDLASRGLDVEGITHIINYDLPDETEVYVHRIGRTARAGRTGTAWSFVEPDQGQKLTEIEKLTNVHIEKLDYPDFEPSPQPENWKPEGPGGRPAVDLPKAPPPKSRFEVHHEPDAQGQPDPEKFPGGVVPKSSPKKTLGSRFRTRRGR